MGARLLLLDGFTHNRRANTLAATALQSSQCKPSDPNKLVDFVILLDVRTLLTVCFYWPHAVAPCSCRLVSAFRLCVCVFL